MNMPDNKSDYDIQNEKIGKRMSLIKRKIVVMSGKGGVGKTTVTVNIASALASMGLKVGILDTDVHGPNVAKMLGCEDGSVLSPDGVVMYPVETEKGIKVMSLAFVLPDPDEAIIWRGAMKVRAKVLGKFAKPEEPKKKVAAAPVATVKDDDAKIAAAIAAAVDQTR